MIINSGTLRSLYTGFSAAFQGGLSQAPNMWNRVAMEVPSTTRQNEYGWLAQMPGMREWLGDRVVRSVETDAYTIKNRTFESTVEVPREDIEDDNVGLYTPLFTEMGRAASALPDQLVFGLLKDGFAATCYDGQYFFDSDHPVLDAEGNPTTASNTGGGSGTAWYLLDTSRAIRPLIFQRRRAFELTRMDDMRDEAVFTSKAYRYGTDGRCNAGYGLWQLAYGSKQTLDETNYQAARSAMMALKGDYSRPMALMPNLLVVPPSLELAARKVVQAEFNASGATNVQAGTAQVLVSPWLA